MAQPPSKKSKMAADSEVSNPYLAHREGENPYSKGTANGSGNGAAASAGSSRSPLNGLVPRQVSVAQAKGIMVRLSPVYHL